MSIEYIGGDPKDIQAAHEKRQCVKKRNAVIANVWAFVFWSGVIGALVVYGIYHQ